MALPCEYYGKEKSDMIKNHFLAREGVYKLMSCGDLYKSKQNPAVNNTPVNTPVRMSFVSSFPTKSDDSENSEKSTPTKTVNDGSNEYPDGDKSIEFSGEKMCYNFGKELYVYPYSNKYQGHEILNPIDKRIYKNTFPTCHDFNQFTSKPDSVMLLVGFTGGQIQLIDPIRKEHSKLFNEERLIDKSPVTCINWVPNSPNQFLVSHSSGQMYLYNEDLPSGTTAPTYQLFKQGNGFSVHTCKTKSTRNPLYRWVLGGTISSSCFTLPAEQNSASYSYTLQKNGGFGTLSSVTSNASSTGHSTPAASHNFNSSGAWNGSTTIAAAVNQFAFSPCAKYLAAVSQDGFLRVFDYHQMELQGSMRSYFGGLLCVSWSPDSRFIAIGGQDDLVTVWSVQDHAVVCRGQGHRSWVNVVRFDSYLCPGGDDSAVICAQESPKKASENHRKKWESESSVDSENVCYTKEDSSRCAEHSESSRPLSNRSSSCIRNNLPTTYRLGSVGQDTLLCLWEVTEDVVRQGLKFAYGAPSNNNYSNDAASLSRSASNTYNFNTNSGGTRYSSQSEQSDSGFVVNNNGLSTASSSNSSQGVTITPHNQSATTAVSTKRSKSETGARISLGHRLSQLGIGTSTLGKEHKKDASSKVKLTRSSLLGTKIGHDPSATRDSASQNPDSEEKILGSSVCPRMEDVPTLEPLLCKQVSLDRLTDLIFRSDSIIIACQQGALYTWARPGTLCTNHTHSPQPSNSPVNSNSASNSSPQEQQAVSQPHDYETHSHRADLLTAKSMIDSNNYMKDQPPLGSNPPSALHIQASSDQSAPCSPSVLSGGLGLGEAAHPQPMTNNNSSSSSSSSMPLNPNSKAIWHRPNARQSGVSSPSGSAYTGSSSLHARPLTAQPNTDGTVV